MLLHATFGLSLILSQGVIFTQSQSDDQKGEEICYGAGAICEAYSDAIDDCDLEQDAHGFDEYMHCACDSGLAGIDIACDKCKVENGLQVFGAGIDWEESCSSRNFTVAPAPSSILAQHSSHTASVATMTGEEPEKSFEATFTATAPDQLPTFAKTAVNPLETGAALLCSKIRWKFAIGMGIGATILLW